LVTGLSVGTFGGEFQFDAGLEMLVVGRGEVGFSVAGDEVFC